MKRIRIWVCGLGLLAGCLPIRQATPQPSPAITAGSLPSSIPSLPPSPTPSPYSVPSALPLASPVPTPAPISVLGLPEVTVLAGVDSDHLKQDPSLLSQVIGGRICPVPDKTIYMAGSEFVLTINSQGNVLYLKGPDFNHQNYGYQNGPLAQARFYGITACSLDGQGNLYLADSSNFVVRQLTPAGQVTTFSGNGKEIYQNGRWLVQDGQGDQAVFAPAEDMDIDLAKKRLLVADNIGNLREISLLNGAVKTLANFSDSSKGTGDSISLTADAITGDIYVVNEVSNNIYAFNNSGKQVLFENFKSGATANMLGIRNTKGVTFQSKQRKLYLVDYDPYIKVFDIDTRKLGRLLVPEGALKGDFIGIQVDHEGNLLVRDGSFLKKIVFTTEQPPVSFSKP